MSTPDSPFGALDKMLLSSTPPERKAPKRSADKQRRKKRIRQKEEPHPEKAVAVKQLSPRKAAKSPQKTKSSKKRPVGQLTGQSIDRSTSQSTNQLTGQLTGKVVDRPVAFYIPDIIHKKIDEAVRYYQEKHGRKVDRSAVVSAFLGDRNNWTEETLDKMVDKVVDQLTSRLTSRLVS